MAMMKPRTRLRGYSLPEMMVVVAILGIVCAGAAGLLTNITRFFRQTSARSEIQRNARTAMEVIGRKVSEAKGHSIVIDRLDANQPYYSRISFLDAEGNTFSFYQSGSSLYLNSVTNGTINQRIIADNLRQLSFTYPKSDDTKLISIGLTFEKATYEGASKTLQLSLEKVRIENPDAS